jgi:hypothetical protein
MTNLALEYYLRAPHFVLAGGKTEVWVVDDHNLVLCAKARPDHEEWCKLFKEFDCWWLIRRDQANKETSSVVKPEEMNTIDDALFSHIAEREFLDG